MATPTESDLDSCLQEARELWAQNEGTLWRIVRGKYILPLFTQKASMMTGGQALLEAIARARPALSRLQPFREAVAEALGSCARRRDQHVEMVGGGSSCGHRERRIRVR